MWPIGLSDGLLGASARSPGAGAGAGEERAKGTLVRSSLDVGIGI